MCRRRPSNDDMLPECAREYRAEEREPEEPEMSRREAGADPEEWCEAGYR